GDGVQRLDEDVRDLEPLELVLDLLSELLVRETFGRLVGHGDGCQSSKRLPSGSVAQPKRPYSCSAISGSTSTPAARSCASMGSRSRTRKLIISCCSARPK